MTAQAAGTPPATLRLPWLEVARRLLEVLCMACLALIVLVASADVIARYVFNAPLVWGFSAIRLLFALLVFLALPLACAADEHLRAGLFDSRWSPQAARARAVVVQLVSLLACAALAWRLGTAALDYAGNGEMLESTGLRMSWLATTMAMLAALGTLATAGVLLRAFLDWQQPAERQP